MGMSDDRDLRRLLLGQWTRRGSLFVPPTRPTRHGEMENIKAYVKFSEIFGREPTVEEFVARLRDIGLRSLMESLSRLMTILHADGVATPGLQLLLHERALTPGMIERLRRLPNGEERIVFFPLAARVVAIGRVEDRHLHGEEHLLMRLSRTW